MPREARLGQAGKQNQAWDLRGPCPSSPQRPQSQEDMSSRNIYPQGVGNVSLGWGGISPWAVEDMFSRCEGHVVGSRANRSSSGQTPLLRAVVKKRPRESLERGVPFFLGSAGAWKQSLTLRPRRGV